MSNAPNYTPTTGFATDETNQAAGRSTVKTVSLDTELANISTSLNAVNTNLKKLQRDDGKLLEGVVEPFTLSEASRGMIASGGTPRGEWQPITAYLVGDVVQNNIIAYICYMAHTSGLVFSASGFWITISGDGSSLVNAQAAAASAAAALVSEGLAEADRVSSAASASAASTSATNASNSATASANSATASAGSATSSANSATSSNTSSVNSANSATAAANSAIQAAANAAAATGGMKNKIIGGNFTTNPWQRGTSFAAITNNTYAADRWVYGVSGAAVHTVSKATDAPSASQAGTYTQHCLSMAVTTADTSIAAGDYCSIVQRVEGFNAASFGFGQAGTRNVTLSFWVKGAKTGIHCVSFINSVADRSYVAEYTINAINTWEYKSITIPVDTAGTWLYDNGIGLTVRFALAAGSTFQSTANSWQVGNFNATANQVNELDTVGNTFKIALVQLEAGSTATAFDTKSVGDVIADCQRYYEVQPSFALAGYNTTGNTIITSACAIPKRATPTISLANTSYGNGSAYSAIGHGASGGFRAQFTVTATGAASAVSDIILSAEL